MMFPGFDGQGSMFEQLGYDPLTLTNQKSSAAKIYPGFYDPKSYGGRKNEIYSNSMPPYGQQM